MKNRIIIIDDDISIRKMLRFIIEKNSLGQIIEELSSGDKASELIKIYNPDIVLIDFLLPEKDGVEIIKESIKNGYRGKFIMISQVKDSDMIGEAYKQGVLFFIHKPINEIEVKSVLENIIKTIEVDRSMEIIRTTLINTAPPKKEESKDDLKKIFSDLGIISEFGINDLKKVILSIMILKERNSSKPYQLKDIFQEVIENYKINDGVDINFKSFEQRIRRLVYKAFENICHVGAEDFYNPIFSKYSNILFDMGEIRKVINNFDGNEEKKGKINVKKFIEGIVLKVR
ncbi:MULTISPECIES: DNA-binding domain-containing protein [Psychrilyobacter]|uniref:Response regulator n=1 Tax=Psychrilyobacter piezotolerans TaxID=2293438 RepID=A0ABX9KI07_9FUSO|nr:MULTISPECIES: DNA-binding domain-containing protein [Psychrilyobacter]MCS5421364.1 response regulator [Psychrilyobacter sp. S5]NDI77489.1 response regulator [Psychrilyobacter piezotolerans]RDE62996.1 response regulator [Psychrilyobacter sp. S5]REI41754.1 response regulator [Psychrilyobacter piezotolerans]